MAQLAPTLDQLLGRMRAYLVEYETTLSSVVADERFDQRVTYTRTYDMGKPVTGTDQRRLDSEIGFIRLPGGFDWLGFRDVKKINGRALPGNRPSIADMLGAAADVMAKARSIACRQRRTQSRPVANHQCADGSARDRPPPPPRSNEFTLRGDERIEGTSVAVIGFEEKQRPTLVVDPSGQQLISRGRIWIEPQTGTIWRVEWIYSPPIGAPASIRVDFRKNEALAMMVPSEMHEEFASLAGRNARGRGRAVYSNYRRFGTGARLVPQQPSRPLVQCVPPSRSSRHHSCPLNRSRRSNNYSAGRGEGRATYKNFRRFGTSARIVPQ